jgi:hypothetical protein
MTTTETPKASGYFLENDLFGKAQSKTSSHMNLSRPGVNTLRWASNAAMFKTKFWVSRNAPVCFQWELPRL